MFRLLVNSSLMISTTIMAGCQSMQIQPQNKQGPTDTTQAVNQSTKNHHSKSAIEYNNWQWRHYSTIANNASDSIDTQNQNNQSDKNNQSKSALEYNSWQWRHYNEMVKSKPDFMNTPTWTVQIGDGGFSIVNSDLSVVSNSKSSWIMSEPKPSLESPTINRNIMWGYPYQAHTVHPQHWKHMNGSQQCGSSKMQSPINIKKALIPSDKLNQSYGLQYLYTAQNFVVINNGHTVTFTPTEPSVSRLVMSGKIYDLVQLNFHANSEHAIMNTHYPVELQMIHKSSDGSMLNMSVFVNVGRKNPSIQPLINMLPKTNSLSKNNHYEQLVGFNVGSLIPKGAFYTYKGSLTTPPCTENVQWLINAKPIKASGIQISQLKSFYNGNNRPIQPLANREVHLIH